MDMILNSAREWSCPNCTVRARTSKADAPTPYHVCKGLRGLNAPLVPLGVDAKVEAVERGDYVGKELVQSDGEGRPVMAIVTTRADGSNDTAILAPSIGVTGELRS